MSGAAIAWLVVGGVFVLFGLVVFIMEIPSIMREMKILKM
jgi:predicted membrane channel-forming protein YqfA (hemolysin III family)